jgi:hypothetical protein
MLHGNGMNKTEGTFFKATAKKIKVQSIIREVLGIERGGISGIYCHGLKIIHGK